MYNLIKYSSNYSETTRSLWFYSKDEATDFNNNIANTDDLKSFKDKTKLLANRKAQPNSNSANRILKNATIVMPLKYLSNFWRSLEIPLINCKVELQLKWTKYCFCLQLVMIIQMLILIILFLPSKRQNYMFQS